MGFKPITIDEYVTKHLKSNPSTNEKALRNRLQTALKDYQNNIKCNCGTDIWVIGSASLGNNCFTCITGESVPKGEFEIDSAIQKNEGGNKGIHIDDMDPTKIGGFFDDDGYQINTDLIKKPSLCISCQKNDDPHEEFLCNMTRYDQKDDEEFTCGAYVKNSD